jgi:predicted transposase YbfD/YdcC
LKGNQPTLFEGVKLLFEEPVSKPVGARQENRHGNRREVRELVVSSELNEWAEWPYLGQVGQLTYTCECTGKISRETSYLITSLTAQEASPGKLLKLMRGHWGIENRVHYVRDVTFDEDRSQVRCGSGPQAMAALRNTTLGVLRLKGVRNIAAAQRTLAWHAKRAIALVTRRTKIKK